MTIIKKFNNEFNKNCS